MNAHHRKEDVLAAAETHEEFHDDIIYPEAIPFVLIHLAALAAIWTGVTAGDGPQAACRNVFMFSTESSNPASRCSGVPPPR